MPLPYLLEMQLASGARREMETRTERHYNVPAADIIKIKPWTTDSREKEAIYAGRLRKFLGERQEASRPVGLNGFAEGERGIADWNS